LNGEIGGTDNRAPTMPGLRQFRANVERTISTLLRAPRRRVALADRHGLALGGAVAIGIVLAAMILLDPRAAAFAGRLSPRVIAFFDSVTQYGKSGWFLWPTGLALLALAWLDRPTAPRLSRLVLAAWSARLGFVFAAIAAPSLFVTIVKRLIGRARPLVDGGDVWSFHFGVWRVDHASFPSGHATTAFAALVAIGAIIPQARALLWIYAVAIALSRVALQTHYPSDVIGGAIVGAFGALLVRNWFAERQLGFTVTPAGRVQPLPGPHMRRIARAIARSLRSMASPTA
jgi:undecaprenyl-diphosphatase